MGPCLGSYGVPREPGVFHERSTPVALRCRGASLIRNDCDAKEKFLSASFPEFSARATDRFWSTFLNRGRCHRPFLMIVLRFNALRFGAWGGHERCKEPSLLSEVLRLRLVHGQGEPSSGSNIIPRRARPGLAGLRPQRKTGLLVSGLPGI